ncbi:MAG: SMC-Scp complex subunit ScpB [Spirochaetaceae bacterium]|jgi:segregation and condensation protein B|nr:SMC-Scp complex subunit ScpB [Spirochaetaceae bacterium]
MDDSRRSAALLEAVLFLEPEALDEPALARASGLTPEQVTEGLAVLEARYREESAGVELSRIAGGLVLAPKPGPWEILKTRYGKKNEIRLSRAALETLSIIAYSQPITRGEIEAIRGASAEGMLRLLTEKNLIRETGKKDAPGKPMQYGTTKTFLQVFRLESIGDLPKLDEAEAERFGLQP